MRRSSPIDIEQRAMNALQLFNWLGNIRQLKNVIERAIILMDRDNIITFDNLPEAIRDMSGKAMFREAKANADNRTGILRQMEELSVRKTLLEENRNVTRAAKRLGISRSMLYRTFKNVLDEFGQ
jgi:two-component system response regulator AtoC